MISNKISLKKFNTFGIDAGCSDFISIKSETHLQKILSELSSPVRVLGGGSNILIRGDLPFTILHNRITGINILKESDRAVIVEVGGGHNWHGFVEWAVDQGYGGIENLALIPGTVGAAPIQNIGAYGVEQSTPFVSLSAVNLSNGKEIILLKEECHFNYRDSIFKNSFKGKYFITSVRYELTKSPQLVLEYGAIKEKLVEHRITRPDVRDVFNIVIEIRSSKLPDPKVLGNSGSFFKNPIIHKKKFEDLLSIHPTIPHYPTENVDEIKLAAGWLIDQCGWKGKIVGNTGTYIKQALVLVNHGNASGEEIWQLAQDIISDVEKRFGIVLIPEVNIW